MSFEDRLRDHLNDQGATIDITPEGPEAAMTRHARRAKNRMAASAVAIALVLVGGFGLWSLADRVPDQQTTVTGETEVREPAERESVDGDIAVDESDPVDDSSDGNETALLSTRLEVVDRVDDNAPGGVWQAKVDNGVYYVLSTAPGEVGIDETTDFDDALYRPNTIYRFDPDAGWTNAEVTDRWISDFTPSDGILYAISTGRVDGPIDAAIGQSTDNGASWDWRPVPELTELVSAPQDEFGYSPTTVRLIPVAGRTFVLAQTMGWPDWDQGAAMAIEAGLPATRSQIVDITPSGVTYTTAGDVRAQDPCLEIMDRYYQATSDIWAERESEIRSEADYQAVQDEIQPLIDAAAAPFEQELADAGCRNEIACQRIMGNYWSIGSELYAPLSFEGSEPPDPEVWREIEEQVRALQAEQAPRLEAELEAAGCENLIRCDRISNSVRLQYQDEQLAFEEMYARYEELTDDEIRDLNIREQALWARIQAETDPLLEEAGCYQNEGVYYEDDGYDPENFVTVTWDELGVTPPDSWSASGDYYEYRDEQLVALDSPFDEEIVVNISTGDSGLELISLPQSEYYGYHSGQEGSVWTTSDGVTWNRSGSSADPYGPAGGTGPGPFTIGNTSIRMIWEEPEMPAPAVDVDFPVIPPDAEILEGEDGQPYFIDDTGAAVSIPLPVPMPGNWVERSVSGGPWERIEIGALVPGALIVQPPDYRDESQIVYSSDGETWNTVAIDADYVSVVSAGDATLFMGSRHGGGAEGPSAPQTVLIRPAR